jgi:hypothetical protein
MGEQIMSPAWVRIAGIGMALCAVGFALTWSGLL